MEEWIMKRFAGLAVIALLLVANIFVGTKAYAHQWGRWHWDRYGATVTIAAYNSKAINDWDSNTILSVPQSNKHTDIHVFDGNYGANGWAGLASIESYSGSHITHGHARVNYYYSMSSDYKKGVFCQEVGHLFGLDHSNTGSCMGLGYWAGNGYTTNSHDWSDIYDMYRFTHH
jgi:predicted Zn-dependent protease